MKLHKGFLIPVAALAVALVGAGLVVQNSISADTETSSVASSHGSSVYMRGDRGCDTAGTLSEVDPTAEDAKQLGTDQIRAYKTSAAWGSTGGNHDIRVLVGTKDVAQTTTGETTKQIVVGIQNVSSSSVNLGKSNWVRTLRISSPRIAKGYKDATIPRQDLAPQAYYIFSDAPTTLSSKASGSAEVDLLFYFVRATSWNYRGGVCIGNAFNLDDKIVKLEAGYTAITIPTAASPVSTAALKSTDLKYFDFNITGTKAWRISSENAFNFMQAGIGYYIRNDGDAKIIRFTKYTSDTGMLTVRRGWNFLANSASVNKKLSELTYSVVKSGSDNTCMEANCFEQKTLAEIAAASRVHSTMYILSDPNSQDAATAFTAVTLPASPGSVEIPAGKQFWLYLKN